jgi:hypothetical protein
MSFTHLENLKRLIESEQLFANTLDVVDNAKKSYEEASWALTDKQTEILTSGESLGSNAEIRNAKIAQLTLDETKAFRDTKSALDRAMILREKAESKWKLARYISESYKITQ